MSKIKTKPSEAKRGQILKYDRLILRALGGNTFFFALQDHPVKRGAFPLDIPLEEASLEDFLTALEQTKSEDAYDALLKEVAAQPLDA